MMRARKAAISNQQRQRQGKKSSIRQSAKGKARTEAKVRDSHLLPSCTTITQPGLSVLIFFT
ncbi:MAG: hypothetical protein DMG63_04045 [Acidobacteria bacterium]|nr:MAG: hypothetical protein DMG63_04045 [Acidobacteriota bacterium]